MLNIYACQHPELQGSEKFLEAFLENADEQERIKKKLVRGKEWAVVLGVFVLPLPWSSKSGGP